MTEPESSKPQSAGPAPAETRPAAGGDFMANLAKIPLAEKILALIAILVVIGWFIQWFSPGGWAAQPLFLDTFASLSFLGALALATLVILKLFAIRPLPAKVERWVIPIASLVPVLGFLIDILNTPVEFLIIGGSLALAYISATTYWRKHIPDFATRPLGEAAGEEKKAGAAPAPPSPPAN